jgi:hypothetical protein
MICNIITVPRVSISIYEKRFENLDYVAYVKWDGQNSRSDPAPRINLAANKRAEDLRGISSISLDRASFDSIWKAFCYKGYLGRKTPTYKFWYKIVTLVRADTEGCYLQVWTFIQVA